MVDWTSRRWSGNSRHGRQHSRLCTELPGSLQVTRSQHYQRNIPQKRARKERCSFLGGVPLLFAAEAKRLGELGMQGHGAHVGDQVALSRAFRYGDYDAGNKVGGANDLKICKIEVDPCAKGTSHQSAATGCGRCGHSERAKQTVLQLLQLLL